MHKYKDAINDMINHEKTKYHQLAMTKAEMFMNDQNDIRNAMDRGRERQIKENRDRVVILYFR
jgi:hypothetical protein